jgi:hypothetical protein
MLCNISVHLVFAGTSTYDVLIHTGVPKDKSKLDAYQDKLEINSQDRARKYHEIVEIPPQADIGIQ